MMAEVVLDVINTALDASENWGKDIKAGLRAIDVGSSLVQSPAGQALKLWGRPARQSACDCERSMDPGLVHKLYTMTDNGMLNKIKARVAKMMKSKMSDEEVLNELVISTLTRMPTQQEQAAYTAHVQKIGNRQAAAEDLLWVLVNTNEFILNH
jgi:hypothetical protein